MCSSHVCPSNNNRILATFLTNRDDSVLLSTKPLLTTSQHCSTAKRTGGTEQRPSGVLLRAHRYLLSHGKSSLCSSCVPWMVIFHLPILRSSTVLDYLCASFPANRSVFGPVYSLFLWNFFPFLCDFYESTNKEIHFKMEDQQSHFSAPLTHYSFSQFLIPGGYLSSILLHRLLLPVCCHLFFSYHSWSDLFVCSSVYLFRTIRSQH